MKEPAQTLIGELEREVSALAGRVLFPGAGPDAAGAFQAAMGRWRRRPGWRLSWRRTTAACSGPTSKLLTLDEAAQRRRAVRA